MKKINFAFGQLGCLFSGMLLTQFLLGNDKTTGVLGLILTGIFLIRHVLTMIIYKDC